MRDLCSIFLQSRMWCAGITKTASFNLRGDINCTICGIQATSRGSYVVCTEHI